MIATSKAALYGAFGYLTAWVENEDMVPGHFGVPMVPDGVIVAWSRNGCFKWGWYAAFDNLDCHMLACGTADVINTKLQLVLPCLGGFSVLVRVTDARVPLTLDSPSSGAVVPDPGMFLWGRVVKLSA